MSASVTYNRNGATGGAVPIDATAYTVGASVTVIGNTGALSLAGYSFSGWNTAADGSGTSYAPGDVFAIAADTTLYAIWSSATSLITPTQLRAHITTSKTDAALQEIIDAEEAEIVTRFGPHASMTEELDDDTPTEDIFPRRPVLSVSSIVETVLLRWDFTGEVFPTTTALSANDYEILAGGRVIRRLMSGDHPREVWGERISIAYTPVSETSRRVLALINLCKLSLQFNGLDSESVGGGEYRMDFGDYTQKRERILSSLGGTQRRFA